MHDLRSIRLVCAPPHKSYDLRGGFSAPSPCRTNDTAFQHLRSGGARGGNARLGSDSSLRRRLEKAPSGSPAALSHNSAATDSLQNSDNPAGRSLRGCLRVSAVHCIRGGPCPLGLPAALSHNSAATDSLQNSDNPAGRSLRVAPRIRGPFHPRRALPPRAPLRLYLITQSSRMLYRQRQPRRPKPAGLPLYDAANAAVHILNRDAGELRLGQITPTALPSSRQTAS